MKHCDAKSFSKEMNDDKHQRQSPPTDEEFIISEKVKHRSACFLCKKYDFLTKTTCCSINLNSSKKKKSSQGLHLANEQWPAEAPSDLSPVISEGLPSFEVGLKDVVGFVCFW